MTLEARLAALEERVQQLETLLERRGPPPALPGDLWALTALRDLAPHGAVLYAGHVPLADDERYEWQMAFPSAALLEQRWDDAAPILAALAHPARLELLRRVLRGQHAVSELQSHELSGSGKLYHHLRDLQAAGWLTAQGRGRYAVPGSRVVPLLAILAATGQLDAAPPAPPQPGPA